MARHDSPNTTTPPPGEGLKLADLLAGWLLLGVGLVMVAFLWLMPGHLELQQLERQRDALRLHVARIHIANEDQQNLLTALENHDPVIIERLACHYLGLRPVGVQGSRASGSSAQLARYSQPTEASDAAHAPDAAGAWMPRRATWQDVVNETTSLRLTSLPALPKVVELPDTQLVQLTTGDKRFFVLALAALCLFAGIRSAPRTGAVDADRAARRKPSAPRMARSEWALAAAAAPAIGTAMSARFAPVGPALAPDLAEDDVWVGDDDLLDGAGEIDEDEDMELAVPSHIDDLDAIDEDAVVDEAWEDGRAAAPDAQVDAGSATVDISPAELDALDDVPWHAGTASDVSDEHTDHWHGNGATTDAAADAAYEMEVDGDGDQNAGFDADSDAEIDAEFEVEADAESDLDAETAADDESLDEDALDLIAEGDGFDAVTTTEAFDEDDPDLFAPPATH